MRILTTLSLMSPVSGGGILDRVLQLNRCLIRKGHACTVLSTSIEWDQNFVDGIGGLEAVGLPCLSTRFMIPRGAGAWLEENIGRFDVVHIAGNWSPIGVMVYRAAVRHGVPFVFSAMGALEIIGRSSVIKRLFRALWTRPMLRDAKAVVAIAPRESRDYVRFGVPATKVALIPNGIVTEGLREKDDEAFRERYGLDDRKIVLFIGRFTPGKGVDVLVEAFAAIAGEYPDHQLLLFGNDHGGFKATVESRIAALGIQRAISVLPPIFGTEKSWAYHAADVCILPSRYDTMTIIALEAAACGCPVIVTEECDFGVIGEHGGLVVPCDAGRLAAAMREMLGDRAALRDRGSMVQEFVLNEYAWDKVSDAFIRLFAEAIDANAIDPAASTSRPART